MVVTYVPRDIIHKHPQLFCCPNNLKQFVQDMWQSIEGSQLHILKLIRMTVTNGVHLKKKVDWFMHLRQEFWRQDCQYKNCLDCH